MHKPTRVRYVVLAWMCFFAMLAYVHRSCLAVPATQIMAELDISLSGMGWAMSMFFWGYAVMQLPGGWFGDRWGSRRVLPVLVLISGLATGLSGVSFGLGMLIGCRALMGSAQAGLFPCAVLSFSHWFPLRQRAFPSGMLAAFMSVGAVVGTRLTTFLLEYLSWRWVFLLFGLPAIVCAAWFYIWFRDRPAEHPSVNDEERKSIEEGLDPTRALGERAAAGSWRQHFADSRLALICGQQFFRAAGYIFYLTWFPTFLQEAHGLSISASGYLTSFPLLGVVAGSALGGLLTDWIFRRTGSQNISRRGVALVSLVCCAAFLASAYWIEDVIVLVVWLTISSFFAGLCGPASYTATIDLGGKNVASVFSIMNMAGNIGAALLPTAVVHFEEAVRVWKAARSERVAEALGKATGWNEVLFFLAGLYVLAALCWVLLRIPNAPRQSEPLAA